MNEKLLAALKTMQNPTRDTKGYGYMYATLDQVMGIVKPALQEQGLDVIQQCSRNIDGGYELSTYVVDDTDGQRLMDVRPLEFGSDAQKVGSYETYMRRYALLTVFGLCPEDDDGKATTAPQSTKKKVAKEKTMLQKASDATTQATKYGAKTKAELVAYCEREFGQSTLKTLTDEQLEKYITWLDE